MGKAPAFQFYANDFLGATITWDAIACGMYIRLLCTQWVNGSIPDDQRRIAKAAGVDLAELQNEWHLLEPKFPRDGEGGRKNLRLEEVRQRQSEVSNARKDAANTRWNSNANAHAKTMQRKVKEKVEGNSEKKEHAHEGFDEFYAAYPLKKSKASAVAAWAKLKSEERTLCKPAIERQVQALHFRGKDGQDYIPHPATWLNTRRWDDEIVTFVPTVQTNGKMTRDEAFAAIEALRQQHGIKPGGALEGHLIPEHIRQALI